jgi:hypothetical protein
MDVRGRRSHRVLLSQTTHVATPTPAWIFCLIKRSGTTVHLVVFAGCRDTVSPVIASTAVVSCKLDIEQTFSDAPMFWSPSQWPISVHTLAFEH